MFHDHWWYCGGVSSSKDVYFLGLKLWILNSCRGWPGACSNMDDLLFRRWICNARSVRRYVPESTQGHMVLGFATQKSRPMLHAEVTFGRSPFLFFIFISNTSVFPEQHLNLTFLRGISTCSRWNNPSQSVGQADPSSLKPESPHKFLRRDFFDLLKPEPTSQTRPALHPWPSPSPSSSWTLIGACGVETHCIFAVQGNFAACFGMKCLFGHCHFLP